MESSAAELMLGRSRWVLEIHDWTSSIFGALITACSKSARSNSRPAPVQLAAALAQRGITAYNSAYCASGIYLLNKATAHASGFTPFVAVAQPTALTHD